MLSPHLPFPIQHRSTTFRDFHSASYITDMFLNLKIFVQFLRFEFVFAVGLGSV